MITPRTVALCMHLQMKASVVYDVEGRQLTLDLKSGNGSASDGQTIAKPDLVISMDSATLLDLAQGKLQPQQAFMKGKLKLKGSMPVAMKVQKVMDAARKAATEVQPTPSGASSVPATPRGGATSTATSAGSAASASSELAAAGPVLKSRAVFDAIGLAVKNDGASLVKKVNGVIQFVICEGSPSGRVLATHLLDLKTGTGSLRQLPSSSSSSSQAASGTAAASPKPDLTLTLSDDDMHLLAGGKLNPQNAFMKGRLKIKGNMVREIARCKNFSRVRSAMTRTHSVRMHVYVTASTAGSTPCPLH